MRNISLFFVATMMCMGLLAACASAEEQNAFVLGQPVPRETAQADSDAVSTEPRTEYTSQQETSSAFEVKRGPYVTRARGGDKLLRVLSKPTLSFFPSKDMALSEQLLDAMDKNLQTCVETAVRAAGIRAEISKINISHMGAYVNRRVINGRRGPKPWSLHATGRALDIGRIDFTAGGKDYRIPMTKATHDARNNSQITGMPSTRSSMFYRKFAKCWNETNVNKCGYKSLLDCNYNSLHHNHIHLALPFCPRKPGIANT